jgi:hypothetical protein
MTARCGERLGDSHKLDAEQPIRRYLGLSVGGAKSERTCLAVIDHYQNHRKSFVVDVFEGIAAEGELNADQVLIDLVEELSGELSDENESAVRVMGVDAPLTLPPCLLGCDSDCPGYEKCRKPEVRWMRNLYLKERARNSRVKHFTPYSQRPVDLYFRSRQPERDFTRDETMGANLAPQAARMAYLRERLGVAKLVEVWPKLALFNVMKPLKLTRRDVLECRNLERGAAIRTRILERLADVAQIFIYERDLKKLIQNMDAFDSFLCAWVAMMSDLGKVVPFKADLPLDSGWVTIPEL